MNYFTEQEITTVQQYLSNQLPDEEQAAFEQRLRQDPRLQEELEWYRAMFAALEETEDQRRKSLLQANAGEKKMLAAIKRPHKKRWAIAAGLLLGTAILFSLWLSRQNREPELFEASTITVDVLSSDLITTRSASGVSADSQAIRLSSIREARLIDSLYKNEKYREALVILEKMPASASILFYRANCLLALDRHEEAIALLQEVETYTNEIYANFAQWYLAWAYYKINDQVQAKAYALKTINNEGIYEADREKARMLLKELAAE